ncbi:MAG: 4Fe-4S single cluster domain-containing protein [bacterium]
METDVTITFNKAHYPVTVLGPGRRLGLWLQGCSIRCPGCISKDTWDVRSKHETTVANLIEGCGRLCAEPPEGITVSGGEPFDQPEALTALLAGLQAWRREFPSPCDILVYSGYDLEYLSRTHPDILTLIDVLIPGPFVDDTTAPVRWRGSDNQTIVLLTPLGRAHWASLDLDAPHQKSLQVEVDETSIWAIGIPRLGDMEALSRLAAERGLVFGGVSW